MLPSFLFCTLLLGGSPSVASTFQQAAPASAEGKLTRSANQTQAVVLIHGFYFHLRDKSVPNAEFRPWQRADSPLVKELAKQADVFMFAYGQNASIDTIVKESKLQASITQLRKLGYNEIVLMGHSAGGLIARQFVEDHPASGVTKVLQVCAPNGGSPLAVLRGHQSQKVFLDCLSESGRQRCLKIRADKRIPLNVQFVCVVARGDGTKGTDGIVPCVNQWTEDLHKQGIPAVGVLGNHREVVRDAQIAETLATVIREKHLRWLPERIDTAKKEIFGK